MFKESVELVIITDREEAAENAGLSYVSDDQPGFQRKRNGKGFVYFDKSGNRVTDESTIMRFSSLVIPPAWTSVWICPKKNGHIQVTGRDVKGRKQYIYHPKWEEIRNETKFSRMIHFGEVLPSIREKVEEDFRRRSLIKEKILATIIILLEETLIRVGNTEYVISNQSYGLTTLQNNHIEIDGSKVRLTFKGKSGRMWEVDIKNKRVAKIVRQCQELPGQELFQYFDENNQLQIVDSSDVNEYLKFISGQDFTAKDFRTWGGTLKMLTELYSVGPFSSAKEFKRNITLAIKNVAKALSNTPTVCRKYYIHPAVIRAYQDGSLFLFFEEALKMKNLMNIRTEELALMGILRNALK